MLTDLLAAPPTVLADPIRFLRATVPSNDTWDLLRLLVVLSTCMLALFYIRIAFGTERPGSHQEQLTIRIGIVGYLWVMLPTALTELEQLGRPVLPWRVPMYVAFNVFGWWYVRRRL